MKKITVITMWSVMATNFLFAQNQTGIHFLNAKNMQEVLQMAKKENKAIFIDAFTTWCIPCRKMDDSTYTDQELGKYMNENFVSIKIQMDSTKNDDESIKSWRSYAKTLEKQYSIYSYPSFIFLDVNGNLINKNGGLKRPVAFQRLAKESLENDQRIKELAQRFRNQQLSLPEVRELAIFAKKLKQDSISKAASRFYKNQYIDKSEPNNILDKETLLYIIDFTKDFTLDDPIVKYLYQHPGTLEKLAPNTSTTRLVNSFVVRDYIYPYAYKNGNTKLGAVEHEPDWISIGKKIAAKLDQNTAKNAVLDAKCLYYAQTKNWKAAADAELERIRKNGVKLNTPIEKQSSNIMLWEVFFEQTDDVKKLNEATGYMKQILDSEPTAPPYIDTYANLLYKLKRNSEAVEYEKQALDIATKNRDKSQIALYSETIEKMKKGIPTWTK
ncbi:thioredoxin family protein [Pedobacter paludis]|uniref:Spermatogenesis-associated protein 20-like TRX domain-containing protein n=1 Tax=Pedobacter paludis TaxID=2203212 RepID=A0A317EZB3_9SPHI|nr:DUF255 domain-containing protein [Pedobacter paludis]PWS32241.1 hypothetical protein DF947_10765 [Pedobacter paludis]